MDILSLNKKSQEYNYSANNAVSGTHFDVGYSDSDLQPILFALHNEALQKISENNFLDAICDLLHCEEILEAVTAKGELTTIDSVIVLLNNLAMCYQRIGDLDKALAYLDGCLFNFKQFSSKPTIKNDIKMNFLIAKISLQYCAMLSQKGLHKHALKFAKHSQSLITSTFTVLIKIYIKASARIKLDAKRTNHVTFRSSLIPSKSSCSVLRALEKYINSGIFSFNLKQKFKFPEWTQEIMISDIMLIQTISLDEMQEDFVLSQEAGIDSLLYKVCLLATSHYCIATELNYIDSANLIRYSEGDGVASEYQRGLDLLSHFLPKNSKLYWHVYEGFIKNCPPARLPATQSKPRINKIICRKKCLTPTPPELSHKPQRSGRRLNSCQFK